MVGNNKITAPIHILYLCNEWKEWDSMRLAMATSDPDKIRKAIRRLIKLQDVGYGGQTEDIETLELLSLNHCLSYAYISTHEDGDFEI